MDWYLKTCLDFIGLGYEICFTSFYGKEAIRMTKIYSHKAEQSVICEQIIHHSDFVNNKEKAQKIIQFLYDDIQEQETTGKYYRP